MTNITAGMVKDLRERTGAGMMDCKGALAETSGDIEAAIDLLRKRGQAKAAKKSGRTAADGLIGVATAPSRGALVEVNSETDFVARGDAFQDFVRKVTKRALEEEGDLDRLLAAPFHGAASAADALAELVGKIGENMTIRRSAALSVSPGIVASYVHNTVAPDLGKIGVIVALESSADPAKLMQLGKQLAMHVAARPPMSITVAGLPADFVARERDIIGDQARQSGKPENVVEKMIEGRMRKVYEEHVLLSQIFVIDDETPVAKVLENASKELGAKVSVAGYVRFAVGEGVDKPKTDFGGEVRELAGR